MSSQSVGLLALLLVVPVLVLVLAQVLAQVLIDWDLSVKESNSRMSMVSCWD